MYYIQTQLTNIKLTLKTHRSYLDRTRTDCCNIIIFYVVSWFIAFFNFKIYAECDKCPLTGVILTKSLIFSMRLFQIII